MLLDLVVLIVAFHLKHFLCDYPLQTAVMLKKNSLDAATWIPALAHHALVHAAGTATVCILYALTTRSGSAGSWAAPLMLVDFATHFAIDRVKAHPRLGGRWKPSEPAFWSALGADQAAHHLVHLAIAVALVLRAGA